MRAHPIILHCFAPLRMLSHLKCYLVDGIEQDLPFYAYRVLYRLQLFSIVSGELQHGLALVNELCLWQPLRPVCFHAQMRVLWHRRWSCMDCVGFKGT